jgi:hypothetical protein
MSSWADALVLLAAACAVATLARWGWRNPDLLVASYLPDEDRVRRRTTIRRGAGTCYVASAVLVVAAVLSLL